MRPLRLITILSLLVGMAIASYAQTADPPAPVDSVEVYFRAGKSTLDPDYMQNSVRLGDFSRSYRQLTTQERAFSADKIRIYATASPEGSEQTNTRLVEQRVRSITRYLQTQFGFSPDIIERKDMLYDWDLLAGLIARSDEPYREAVLDIVRSGSGDAAMKSALRSLDGGRTWSSLLADYFPQMRYTHVTIGGKYAELKARRQAYIPLETVRTAFSGPVLEAPRGG